MNSTSIITTNTPGLRFTYNARYQSQPNALPSDLESFVRAAIDRHVRNHSPFEYIPVSNYTKSATKLICSTIPSNNFVRFEETHVVFPKNRNKACYIKGVLEVVDQQLLAEMRGDGLSGWWDFELHGELMEAARWQRRNERISAITGAFSAVMY